MNEFKMLWYFIDPFLKYQDSFDQSDYMQYQVDGTPFVSMGFK